MSIAHKTSGFTLIELMIVIAVIAIVAVISIPVYNSYVTNAKRVDAKISLILLQLDQEHYRAKNSQYGTHAELKYPSPHLSAHEHYEITLVRPTPSTYIATATPQGAQAGDSECAKFTIDQDGTKGITGTGTSANCWQR